MFIDAHCHLESIKNFVPSKDTLPVTCGYSHNTNIKNLGIGMKLGIPFVMGISPQAAIKEGLKDLDKWVSFIKTANPKPNAIGEVGLDYHWAKNKDDTDTEWAVFDRMIELANEIKLPLVIHSRKAEGEVIRILKEREFKNGIMMHFFSGSEDEAIEAVGIGSYISIPPIRSKERKKVINAISIENILVETDAPAVGRTPSDVIRSIEYVAEVKKLDVSVVAGQTTKNAIKFFNIKT